MLNLRLKPGEYMTIGGNVVLQYDCTVGDSCKLLVSAPREVPVVRGTVLEKNGEKRPDCIVDRDRSHKGMIPWNRNKAASLAVMRRLLATMDGRDARVRDLRKQLDQMFPPVKETGGKDTGSKDQVSLG